MILMRKSVRLAFRCINSDAFLPSQTVKFVDQQYLFIRGTQNSIFKDFTFDWDEGHQKPHANQCCNTDFHINYDKDYHNIKWTPPQGINTVSEILECP